MKSRKLGLQLQALKSIECSNLEYELWKAPKIRPGVWREPLCYLAMYDSPNRSTERRSWKRYRKHQYKAHHTRKLRKFVNEDKRHLLNHRSNGNTHGGLKTMSVCQFEKERWKVPAVRPRTLHRTDVFFDYLDDVPRAIPTIRSWKSYRKRQYKPTKEDDKMTFDERMSFASKEDLLRFLMKSHLGHQAIVLEDSDYTGIGAIPAILLGQAKLDAALHEASHMLDFFLRGRRERIFVRNFGFHYSQNDDYGDEYDEPSTTQALHAEMRAFALQLCLMRDILGLTITPHELFQKNAMLIAGKPLMVDAFQIPERRAMTRFSTVLSRQANDRYHRLKEQRAAREEIDVAMREDSRLGALSVNAYKEDRVQYALKHMVKYYLRLEPATVLSAWHEMFDWVASQGHVEHGDAA